MNLEIMQMLQVGMQKHLVQLKHPAHHPQVVVVVVGIKAQAAMQMQAAVALVVPMPGAQTQVQMPTLVEVVPVALMRGAQVQAARVMPMQAHLLAVGMHGAQAQEEQVQVVVPQRPVEAQAGVKAQEAHLELRDLQDGVKQTAAQAQATQPLDQELLAAAQEPQAVAGRPVDPLQARMPERKRL